MRLGAEFYRRDVLEVAEQLLGKVLCRATSDGVLRGRISEIEAYRGEDDTACHAHKGRTKRTEPLYHVGGCTYVYLCYGIHHLMNVVTGVQGQPQAALIRGLTHVNGPGRLTRAMGITINDNLTNLTTSTTLWLEDDGYVPHEVELSPRIGIGYASPVDQARLWRYVDPAPGTGSVD